MVESGSGLSFIGCTFEEVAVNSMAVLVAFFNSRMDLFIKSVVAQCGLRGLSEAFEGFQGVPSAAVLFLLEANALNPVPFYPLIYNVEMLFCAIMQQQRSRKLYWRIDR